MNNLSTPIIVGLGLLLVLFAIFLGYFLVGCFYRHREMKRQDDYYRGYNEMYNRCIMHGGIASREVSDWLTHSESAQDNREFDRGVVDAYRAYVKNSGGRDHAL